MKLTTTLIATAVILSLTSCNEKAQLASQINGTWSGQAERVTTPETTGHQTTTTVTRMYTFNIDPGSKTGGTIDAVAYFSVESGTELQAAGTQPIAVTIEGNATICGRWEAIDDDELAVTFDSSTLAVNVNPDAIELEYNIDTQQSFSVADSIKPQLAQQVTRSMKNVMNHNVFNFAKIEDVKVKDMLMSCEIGHKDYTLHRDR
ncbi:MAG: hypothetical protein NC082_04705 [Clostridiales bacterium]|nr:hypothetical protein [Clostridiales bacterium]